jgi:hypothetical protein
MGDIVLFLMRGAFVWAAAVVGFVSFVHAASYVERLVTRGVCFASNGCNPERHV